MMKRLGGLAALLLAVSCQSSGPRVPIPDGNLVAGKPPVEQLADNQAAQAILEEYAKRYKEGYPLYPGDLVQFTTLGNPELSPEVRVPTEGYINFPLIGKVVLVGRTANEVREDVQKRLAADYLQNPDVTLMVREYSKKKVYIIGSVKTPQDYELPNGRMITLLQAITQAGGFTDDAEKHQVLLFRTRTVGGHERITVPVDVSQIAIGAGGADPLVIPDDIISVPSRDKIFVLGQVQHPGSFNIPADHKTTVTQAIAMAGGLTRISAEGSVRLIRKQKDGTRSAYLVDVGRVISGHPEEDAPVQPGDTIFVPESFF